MFLSNYKTSRAPFLTRVCVFASLLQCFGATASGTEYDNPKVKPSASANAIYSLAARCVWVCCFCCCWYDSMCRSLGMPEYFVCCSRPLPAVKQFSGEDGCENNDEDSDYMTPSSLPVLATMTPSLGEAVPRPHHPNNLNSR